MRIIYFSSGSSIHDEQFLKKFGASPHRFCFASMHHHLQPVPDGIPYHYLGGDDRQLPGPPGRALAAFRMFGRLRNLISRWKPDLIYAGPVNTAGPLAVATGFRPLLLMPWGTDVLLVPDRSIAGRLIVRHTLRQAALITCDAAIVRDRIVELASFPQERIVIAPWGIDLERFQPRPDARDAARAELGLEEGPVILMNRSHKAIYGIEYFLRALPGVFAIKPNAVAIIAGDGPLKDSLMTLAGELGLTSRVRFVGAVDNERMPRLLHAADIYVSSSLSDGTSISLLEAMACGLPVVVSDLPANREWVVDGQNGLLVQPQDIDGIGGAIIRVLENPVFARAMGERNIEIARERADWDRNYARIEEMFDEIGAATHAGALSA